MPLGNSRYTQTWDNADRVQLQTDALGNTHEFEYADGVTTITDPTDATAVHTYGGNGELIGLVEEDGLPVAVDYDGEGQRSAVHDRLGDTSSMTWHFPSGKLGVVENADGTTTEYSYTERGTSQEPLFHDLTQIDYPHGGSEQFSYDDLGNLTHHVDMGGETWLHTHDHGQILTLTNPAGGALTHTYDASLSPATTTDPAGNTTIYDHDALLRVSQVTHADGSSRQLVHDDNDRISSLTDELGRTTTWTWDANNNLEAMTDALGDTTEYDYDTMDRAIAAVDSTGVTTWSAGYGELGRLQTVADGTGAMSTFAYDSRGHRTSIQDGAGETWTRGYNDEGGLVSASDPLGNTTTFELDLMGRVTSIAGASGDERGFEYDERNRVSGWAYPGDLGTLDISYDAMGSVIERSGSDGTESSYTYDDLDRLTAAGGLTLGYDHHGEIVESNGLVLARDAAGRIVSVTFAPGKTVTYHYDGRGQLTELEDWAGGVSSFTMDAAGRTGIRATTASSHLSSSRITGSRRFPSIAVQPASERPRRG